MTTDSPPLEVTNVSFSYGELRALQSVNFTVERGSFTILLGHNGAGKTTLFSLLTGLYHAHQGRITINGYNLVKQPSRALHQMGIVFQQRSLDADLTVWQNIRYSANLYGLSTKEAKRRTVRELERFELEDRIDTKIRHLSGGQVRRTEIARALVQQPRLLILDEPTVGLDVRSRSAIIKHVRDLCKDGLSVLWTTHLLDEVEPGDTVLILKKSELTIAGTARELTASSNAAEMKNKLSALL